MNVKVLRAILDGAELFLPWEVRSRSAGQMESEGSSSWSQNPTTGPHPVQVESSPHLYFVFLLDPF